MLYFTISRESGYKDGVLCVSSSGDIDSNVVYGVGPAVRPSFYLTSTVTTSGGTGTQSNPYRIEL